jgi:hypothetical protein
MRKLMKSSFYATIWLLLIGLNNVSAISAWSWVNENLRTAWTADQVIQTWLGNLLWFLYLVAVILAIWGGFNILTASGDEEKVKKGKTIILQAIGWVVVIFLAGSIIDWLLNAILGWGAA